MYIIIYFSYIDLMWLFKPLWTEDISFNSAKNRPGVVFFWFIDTHYRWN